MEVVAAAGTGRAVVTVDAENEIRRNFIRDPRFSTTNTDNWGVVQVGPATALPSVGSDPVDPIKLGVVASGAGGGVRLQLLPHPLVVPGVTVRGWVQVQNASGYPAVGQWQARMVSTGAGASGAAVITTGAGVAQFTGVVGSNNDMSLEVVALQANNFLIPGAYAGLTARAGTFSGGDEATATASYRWTGPNARSVSEEILTSTAHMSVFRSVDGVLTPVRGYQNVRAVGAVVSDNDVPLRTPVRYVVVMGDGTRYYSDHITVQAVAPDFAVPTSWPILSNPVTGRSVRVIIREWDEKTIANEGKRIRVPGRRSPVVIADIENTPESTVVLETATTADRAVLDELLAPGQPVLLRAPCARVDDAYIHVDSRSVRRNSPASQTETRVHTLSVVEMDPPDMDLRGRGDTLGDLHAAAPNSLQEIALMWPTLGDMASADLIGGGW